MTAKLPAKTLFTALLAVVLASAALAQTTQVPPPSQTPQATKPAAAPGAGAGGGMPRYEKASETTLKGPIEEVKMVDTPSGVQGTRLILKQGDKKIEVYAGPAPFFARAKITFTKGEMIEVTGSKVEIQGTPALLAKQISKGGQIIVLRDDAGRPVWARQPQ
ncbi:MAG TPA: hypothetical protein VMM92_03580 [Thermoanaerobaculia bacterium]|nr:hypothetical protein [Thermoanaerobaculia bacterium]